MYRLNGCGSYYLIIMVFQGSKDNDKIFQPFFTTTPIGRGTGLGLSLAYDMIKAHIDEIKVEAREKKCAKFIFRIPAV